MDGRTFGRGRPWARIWLVLIDDRPSEPPDERLLILIVGLLTTPLGGAVAHELGGPRGGAGAGR